MMKRSGNGNGRDGFMNKGISMRREMVEEKMAVDEVESGDGEGD